ncbi:MAG TPA: SRPBCC family protein [Thermoleophilaceae bacterium]|nr:SRPBCC family protein [Thermoleophilaceae bacterium]
MIIREVTVVPAAPEEVWGLVSDPAQLPRWWPGVTRVEEASDEAWTTVLSSPKGKSVRVDYSRVEAEPPRRVVWRQEVDESPFERILASSTTEIALEPSEGGTRVTVSLDQRPRGWARFAPLQFRGAGKRQVRGAVEGLDAVFGGGDSA